MIPIIFMAATFIASPLLHAEESTYHLTLLTEENHPYSYVNKETGSVEGSAVTIITNLMQEVGVSYTLTLLPWQRTYRRARTEQNTCAFPTNRTEERETLFRWVGPIHEGGWAVFKRPGSDIIIEAPNDMHPYVVTGKMGSPSVDSIIRASGIKVIRAGNDETAARLLFHGRADLWISGVLDGPYAAQKAGLPQPELAFLWRRAVLSLACHWETNLTLIRKLNAANGQRIKKLRETTAQNNTG